MRKTSATIGCLPITLLILFNFFLGGWSVQVILSWFGKSAPFLVDGICGIIAGEVTIPIAIIGKLLSIFMT